MATNFTIRLLVVAQANRVAAVASFLQTLDAGVDALLGPPLNASGNIANAVQARWQCASWTDAQALAIINRLCDLASVARPTLAQFQNATRAQKRTWWNGVRDTVRTNFGVYVVLMDNEGQWDNPYDVLTFLGQKPAIDLSGAHA